GMIKILIIVLEVLTTIFQAFLMVWTCNSIASKENKISKINFIILNVIILAWTLFFGFNNNGPYGNLIMVIGALLFCIIFYRKSIIDAILGFGTVYSVIVISSYFFIAFYKYVISAIKLSLSNDFQMIIFVFLPAWLIYIAFFKFGEYILNAVLLMKTYTHSLLFFIIITYTMIVLDTLRAQEQAGSADSMFKLIFYLMAFMIFVFVIVYFARVNEKSKEAEMLNEALKAKITELRKVKHDYGSEISGLFGLYQLGRYDRLGDMLKNIVERNQALNTSVYVNVQASPIISSILTPISSTNIDLIVFDTADYNNLSINDDELLKVLSNIIRNSLDALKGVKDPIIKFKSYNIHNAVVINISNNGPEIPAEIMDKIFEAGFSTKGSDDGERGYGLSIVKEIINNCNGKININSSGELTEFNIQIPYK
ncbi:MAG: putative sensor histidine kinase, partial [Clostridiaceae bacterium]|nr:putative sensor histidine kinase [Clostridiaceae bacterium]